MNSGAVVKLNGEVRLTELCECNREILGPAEEGLFKECKGDHHSFVIWRYESNLFFLTRPSQKIKNSNNETYHASPEYHSHETYDQRLLPVTDDVSESCKEY